MRVAFLSDIHANLSALTAVLADINTLSVDAVYCLGDIVGYGPDPEEVTALIRAHDIPALMGNHELALLSRGYYNSLNPTARSSIDLTRDLLSTPSLHYLTGLPPAAVWHGWRCVHGCPPDSITTYLHNPSHARLERIFATFPENRCCFGHTHNLALFRKDATNNIRKETLGKAPFSLAEDDRAIINIGSVGQPRDGNNNAKYLLWDQDKEKLTIRFVPYDIRATAEKLKALGFPSFNARRLW